MDTNDLESTAKNRAQELVDEITHEMCQLGYPVEMTHKAGFQPNRIDVGFMGGWSTHFEENLARVLIEGYSRKGSLVKLLEIIMRKK